MCTVLIQDTSYDRICAVVKMLLVGFRLRAYRYNEKKICRIKRDGILIKSFELFPKLVNKYRDRLR